MRTEETDILIIGAGAAGAVSSWNLSKTKLKVTCLEQGPFIDKKKYSFNNKFREINKIYDLNSNPTKRKSYQDFPINCDNSPISISNFNAVGGSTLIYSGHYPRFHSSDFYTKKSDNVSSNWLFNYRDLEKYYDLNDKMMGVSGLKGDPAYPNIDNLLPPIDIGYAGQILAKAFNKLKWHWWPSYSAVKKSKKFSKGIRPTVVEVYLNKALKNGLILKPNCNVLKILNSDKNTVSAVIYKNQKNEKIYLKCKLIILAASGIGTPRLLLNSANKDYPKGLANFSGKVGKNLMLHPLGFVEGKFKQFLASNEGAEGCSLFSHEFYNSNSKRGFKRGYTIQHLRSQGPVETYYFLKQFKKINFGKNFFKNFFEYFGKSIHLAIICEDFAEEKNRIELDFKNRDKDNMPGVKIKYKLSKNSKMMLSHGLNKCKKLLVKAGAKRVTGFGPVRNTGWHIMGTTKMGKSRNNSVVNGFGKCHDIKNLFIVDSSIFPSSSGVNIASTVQAVSLMISSHIKKNLNKYMID